MQLVLHFKIHEQILGSETEYCRICNHPIISTSCRTRYKNLHRTWYKASITHGGRPAPHICINTIDWHHNSRKKANLSSIRNGPVTHKKTTPYFSKTFELLCRRHAHAEAWNRHVTEVEHGGLSTGHAFHSPAPNKRRGSKRCSCTLLFFTSCHFADPSQTYMVLTCRTPLVCVPLINNMTTPSVRTPATPSLFWGGATIPPSSMHKQERTAENPRAPTKQTFPYDARNFSRALGVYGRVHPTPAVLNHKSSCGS